MPKPSQLQLAIRFGVKLKEFRKSKGMSAEETAKKCRMTRSQWYKYECGDRLPTLQVFSRLVKGLDCQPEELLGYLEKP